MSSKYTMALIYQCCVETCAYLRVMIHYVPVNVIHENLEYGQSQLKNQQVQINAVAENDCQRSRLTRTHCLEA